MSLALVKAHFFSNVSAILFLDPPAGDVITGSRYDTPTRVRMPSEPYQGGYNDFIKFENMKYACATEGPQWISMLDDLCYYWANFSDQIDIEDQLAVSTIFLKKIIVSNYMLLIEYVRGLLSGLEWVLSRREGEIRDIDIDWTEQKWSDVQSWSRRLCEYCDNVEGIVESLDILLSGPPASKHPMSCEKDFQLINKRLLGLKARADALVSSFTGLAGILGNRQALREANRSLHEAKSVKVLTLLGMLFLPLSFVSGLLRMNDPFTPGTPGFAIYIAVSIPLVVIVFCVVFLINLGYGTMGYGQYNTGFVPWETSKFVEIYITMFITDTDSNP